MAEPHRQRRTTIKRKRLRSGRELRPEGTLRAGKVSRLGMNAIEYS